MLRMYVFMTGPHENRKTGYVILCMFIYQKDMLPYTKKIVLYVNYGDS